MVVQNDRTSDPPGGAVLLTGQQRSDRSEPVIGQDEIPQAQAPRQPLGAPARMAQPFQPIEFAPHRPVAGGIPVQSRQDLSVPYRPDPPQQTGADPDAAHLGEAALATP